MKKNRIFQNKNTIKTEVWIALLREHKSHIVYCPALDISAYGDNPDEAIHSFKVSLKIFLEDALKRGTLERTLLNLGWTLQQKPKPKYVPPRVSKIGYMPRNIRTQQITIPFIPSTSPILETTCH